jgi:hypothetical protein
MTKSLIRLALIATVSIGSVSLAFAQQAPATEKKEVKTEVKTESKEKKKLVSKKKADEKKCCQVKVEKL